MSAVNTKELAQCLAFAYFAEHPKYEKPVGNKDTEHAIRFYTLVSGRENVTNYKKKYLSNTFPIDKVKKEFAEACEKRGFKKGSLIRREKVRKLIIEERFKRLQNHLKGDL